VTRRSWVVGAVAVVVAVALAVLAGRIVTEVVWDGDDNVPVSIGQGDPPSSRGAGYVVDFSRPGAAAALADMTVTQLGPLGRPAAVHHGVLRQGASGADPVASYFFRRTDQPARRLGVEVRWPKPDNPGTTAVMLQTDGPAPEPGSTNPRPSVPIHFVITSTSWQIEYWPAERPKPDVVLHHSFDSAELDRVRFEIRLVGPKVTVVQPDGKRFTIEDARFGKWKPRWSGWELYQNGGDAPSAGIASWWSD
jgi:hypothetical protein